MRLLPNLFVIGAMKSGTTSLCCCLNEHKEIYISPNKEPRFFSHNRNFKKGYEHYLKNFSGAVDEKYLCEGSTDYAKRPGRDGVAQRIHEFNPDSKFIYIMRDPFRRTISQYLHQIRMQTEWRGILDAIENKAEYIYNSNYAFQIQPYIKIFGEEAVYTCIFEDMVKSPKSFYRNLFEWLGVDSTFVPKSAGEKFNSSSRIIAIVKYGSYKTIMIKYIQSFVSKTFLKGNYFAEILPVLLLKQKYIDVKSKKFNQEVEAARVRYNSILKKWILDLSMITKKEYDNWL